MVYVCNLMTKHGETDGFRASDFVREIQNYLDRRLDRVILHDGSFPDDLLAAYAAKQQYPVEADISAVRKLVPEVIVEPVMAVHSESLVRHDARTAGARDLRSPVDGAVEQAGRLTSHLINHVLAPLPFRGLMREDTSLEARERRAEHQRPEGRG